jgi:hypothetical protein
VVGHRNGDGSNGAPLLPAWLACFECATYASMTAAITRSWSGAGRVLKISSSAHTRVTSPLLFFRGSYCALNCDQATPSDADLWLHGW